MEIHGKGNGGAGVIGQISLDDYISEKRKSLEEEYPIPRLSHKIRRDEGWYDDWHYSKIEEPQETDAYYTIKIFGDNYIYTYCYWGDRWYEWNSSFEKWVEARNKPFAWVKIPSEYRRRDPSLRRRLENAPIRWIGGER